MAAWDLAVTAIQARFRGAWDGHTPVLFENGEGADGKPFTPPNGPWVHLRVHWADAENAAIDGTLKRRYGSIWVYAFIPLNKQGADAHRLAARAATIFEDADFGGVDCFTAIPGGEADAALPHLPAGRWYGQCASVSFTYDEIKP